MRRVAGIWLAPMTEGTVALVITATFFAFGAVVGALAAMGLGDAGSKAVDAYLEGFLAAARSGTLAIPGWGELLWRSLRWPLGVVLLGVTALGVPGIPVLGTLRGFLLTFSSCAFVRACGWNGLVSAFFLFGLPSLVAVPAFLVLSVQGFLLARSLWRQKNGRGTTCPIFDRSTVLRCGVCAAAIGLSVLAERYLVPILVTGYASLVRP